jgi:hypothetical protein
MSRRAGRLKNIPADGQQGELLNPNHELNQLSAKSVQYPVQNELQQCYFSNVMGIAT